MTTPPSDFKSSIVSEFPPLLNDLRDYFFHCIYRGSRDGFGAADFHRCCDNNSNTVTLIEDTFGNIFGGYTHLTWETGSRSFFSSSGRYTLGDSQQRSYVFTLKNPHDFPPTKFGQDYSIGGIQIDRSTGPSFVDFTVADNGNSNWHSSTGEFGKGYKNDTDIPGGVFFTGSWNFKVKEVEVFKLIQRPNPPGVRKEYPVPTDGSVNGILASLKQGHWDTPYDLGLVTLSSKSPAQDTTFGELKNIVDIEGWHSFESHNEPDQWIRWDFGPRLIRATHYNLKAVGPITWLFEGSMDGENWTELDRQTGVQAFSNEGEAASLTFAIAKPIESRSFRLTVTERIENGKGLIVTHLEFFGTLIG